jgi:alpha-tubulin suppressor-like RCC1 family protein
MIAAGEDHGVWLKADGTVWTWGSNHFGQLLVENEESWAPMRVPGFTGIRSIAAGSEFTMVLKADGTVWAWGRNQDGELGIGTKDKAAGAVQVHGLTAITAIAAAGSRAVALDTQGAVWAWGSDPNRSSVLAPARIEKLANVVAIAAGETHSVALDASGAAWAWGDSGPNYAITPEKLPGFDGIASVAAAYRLTIGLTRDGTVLTLGYGTAGQLGNGTNDDLAGPVTVSGLANVKAIAAGTMHVLALKADGTVWSWGLNREHQLGNLAVRNAGNSNRPVRTGTLAGVIAIAAAAGHSLALTADGVLWGWGQNRGGALGSDPETMERADLPMRVGVSAPPKCDPLFSCETWGGKGIEICGEQGANADQWTNIQYRYGPASGIPELVFPKDPSVTPPPFFFSHESRSGEYFVHVRFTNGAYTYRVWSGEHSAGGVEVTDSKGKVVTSIRCGERPYMFAEYMRRNMQCDRKGPLGVAGCREHPAPVK